VRVGSVMVKVGGTTTKGLDGDGELKGVCQNTVSNDNLMATKKLV